MAVLADHVTRRVSIAVFGIVVGALVEECLEDLRVAADAGHVQRCPQILGFAV